MRRGLGLIFRGFLLPASLYALVYYLFSYPLWHSFSTHFFCGQEDGYQNIWNLWWVNKAVTELHQSPWYTTWLHYPTGTSLIAHTLVPFDGFVGIVLLKMGMTLNEAYNTILIFSFVMTGVTAFWLCWRVSGSYIGALFAGAAFTFCHFHFAHARNHLQMASLEWLPLAVLAVYEVLMRPTVWKGAGAAGAIFLVALCDFHLTFYVVLAGSVLGVVVAMRLAQNRWAGFRGYIAPLVVFVLLVCATAGVLALKLLMLNHSDPLKQNHDAKVWSTDWVDPFIPGAEWRFNEVTRPVWGVLATPETDFGYVEHSLYIGWVVLGLCAWAVWRRRELGLAHFRFWLGLMGLFFLMSLGPWMHIGGRVNHVPGIYWVLEWIFPPLKVGSVPMRMMAMVFLVGAVIAGAGLGDLIRLSGRRGWVVVCLVLAVWAFENLSKAQPTTPATYPKWVLKLRDLPAGAVVDTTYQKQMSLHLYYATGHGKPVGEGYISRYPKSVEEKRGEFRRLVEAGDWETLGKEWGFKYLVINRDLPDLKLLIRDGETRVYELGN